MPEHYIRYIEPIESELATQVEYDMDEQGRHSHIAPWGAVLTPRIDQEWLDTINAERKKEQLDPVTYEFFEVIMDRLEKEWFDLVNIVLRITLDFVLLIGFKPQMKRVPKQETALPSEDSTCAICDDGEGENSNAIVFCDGCNLAVHQGTCLSASY